VYDRSAEYPQRPDQRLGEGARIAGTGPVDRDPQGRAGRRTRLDPVDHRELLLGRDLPFDYTIHLALSSAARRRRMPEEWQWTLPAYDDYATAVDPLRSADVVLSYDDPAHPAIRISPASCGSDRAKRNRSFAQGI